MIQTNNKSTLKEMRDAEKQRKEAELKAACEKLAYEKYGEEQVKQWSNKYKGLWYLPVIDDDNNIEAMAIMRPIDRHILSFASTKIEDEGLYVFLEACMRECWVEGDQQILEDDEYFIPCAMKFNKILEGKKAAFIKR
ncbi:MAG: hypothetical protein EKK39_14935 [Sphingobacteriales bacterium]|nr:MAG: hypothetical protein EKK39_14935 [Sphingobacteriales bacterium]